MPFSFDKKVEEEYEDDNSSTGAGLLEENGSEEYHPVPMMERKKQRSCVPYIIHGGVLLTYTILFFVAIWTMKEQKACRHADLITCKSLTIPSQLWCKPSPLTKE